jgi:hypothetical protein
LVYFPAFSGALLFNGFMVRCFFVFCALFLSPAQHTLAGFLLSAAPDWAGHMGKVFEKKIRSLKHNARRAPMKKERKIIFPKPVGPDLDQVSLLIRNLLYIKGQWLLKKSPYMRLLKVFIAVEEKRVRKAR